jgi:hypothetical protein
MLLEELDGFPWGEGRESLARQRDGYGHKEVASALIASDPSKSARILMATDRGLWDVRLARDESRIGGSISGTAYPWAQVRGASVNSDHLGPAGPLVGDGNLRRITIRADYPELELSLSGRENEVRAWQELADAIATLADPGRDGGPSVQGAVQTFTIPYGR